MFVQRWTRDAVLAKMAAESAVEMAQGLPAHDRAVAKLAIEEIRTSVETGAITPEAAATKFDHVRQALPAAA